MSIKPFRDKLLGVFLKHVELDQISSDDFSTQSSLAEEHGRPDMAITNDNFEILFEVKINDASLTKNQPASYLNHLLSLKEKKKWLIFIVPERYGCLADLRKRLDQLAKTYGGNHIGVRVIFWEKIIEILRADKKTFNDTIFLDFLDLLEGWYGLRKINFNTKEAHLLFDKNIPGNLVKLFSIIKNLRDYYKKNNRIKLKLRINSNDEEYGLYFANSKGENIFYIGVWFSFWEKHGKPICYGIDLSEANDSTKKLFARINRERFRDEDGWRMSWIEINSFKSVDIAALANTIDSSLIPLIGKFK